MDNNRIGICCPGGGAAGATQAGMLCAFKEWIEGGKITAVSGASVGGLNAAMAVQGRFHRLGDLWCNIRRSDVYSRWGLLKPWTGGYYDTAPLKALIDQHVDILRLAGSETRLIIQACDRDTGEPVVWKSGYELTDLKPMLLASASIPVVFPQVYARGHWLVDGGVVDNSPMEWLLLEGCNEIWVLHCHPYGRPAQKEGQRSRLSMLSHTIRLLYMANQKHDTRIVRMHNALTKALLGERKIIVREVYPTVSIGTLDFDRKQAQRGFRDGYMAASCAIADYNENGGKTDEVRDD